MDIRKNKNFFDFHLVNNFHHRQNSANGIVKEAITIHFLAFLIILKHIHFKIDFNFSWKRKEKKIRNYKLQSVAKDIH